METRKLQQIRRKQYEEYFKVRPGHIAHELNLIRKEMNLINTQPLKEKKKESKELTARKKELVDWLIKYQNRNALRTSYPKQMKALNRISDKSHKNMSWNKHSEDGEESVIDFETGEITQPLD